MYALLLLHCAIICISYFVPYLKINELSLYSNPDVIRARCFFENADTIRFLNSPAHLGEQWEKVKIYHCSQ